MQVRAADTLWHKERLINWRFAGCHQTVGLSRGSMVMCCLKIPDWQKHAMELLGTSVRLQLFSDVALMPSPLAAQHDENRKLSMVLPQRQAAIRNHCELGDSMPGHTGFAWAMRRDVLSQLVFMRLYRRQRGSCDGACAARWTFATCVTRLLGLGTPHHRRFCRLGRSSARRDVSASAGEVALYRGGFCTCGTDRSPTVATSIANNQRLLRLGFDPRVDLLDEPGQPWRLRDQKRRTGGVFVTILRSQRTVCSLCTAQAAVRAFRALRQLTYLRSLGATTLAAPPADQPARESVLRLAATPSSVSFRRRPGQLVLRQCCAAPSTAPIVQCKSCLPRSGGLVAQPRHPSNPRSGLTGANLGVRCR